MCVGDKRSLCEAQLAYKIVNAAAISTSGEERERRLFSEALRDGYVFRQWAFFYTLGYRVYCSEDSPPFISTTLVRLMNKFLAGMLPSFCYWIP